MSELTFGSLFAGVGGADLGFERAGLVCKWQVEIDAKCSEVLAHHWPEVERYGDIRDFPPTDIFQPDIIVGGFPCVGLSVAGRRAGLADERSGLWWEMLRVIEELRPTWVVIENVPGLRSSWSCTEPSPRDAQVRDFHKKSDAEKWAKSMACDWEVEETSDLETILASLGQLGYWWAFRSLDAQYHDLAQRRERVFIVGRFGDMGGLECTQSKQDISGLAGLPAKVLFEPESLSWDSAPSRETREKAAYTLTASVRKSGDGHGQAWNTNYIVQHALSAHNQRNDPDGEHFVVATLNSGGNSGGFRTEPGEHLVAFDWQSGGDVRLNISSEHTSAMQASQTPAVLTGMGVRRLTVTECERLQGFPDNFTAVDGTSNTARYRQLGNAVAVPVAQWIGRRILNLERKDSQWAHVISSM